MKSKAFLKKIKEREILNVEELEFLPGKVYAVMGPNGCGKTTFARCIALEKGLEEEHSVGYMPQKNFPFRMSVLKNVMLTADSEDAALSMLSALGMGALAGSNAKVLSGGEAAKLALARVLLKKTELLILDEPTSPMDTEGTLTAEKLIKKYATDNNAAIILITHSRGQARRLADELLFFSDGKLLEKGPVSELLDDPKTPQAKQFFDL